MSPISKRGANPQALRRSPTLNVRFHCVGHAPQGDRKNDPCRLSERQTQSGGLQGRPEKLQDVCYSWWAVASLRMLRRAHWIDRGALRRFILNAQDEHGGGIADRPDDMVDVFHTFFGVAALSLLEHPGLEAVNATYALPEATVRALGL